jgi:hypothetical protein
MPHIEDEFGLKWHVGPGHPAKKYVNLLTRERFNWIVLPRLLFCGIVDTMPVMEKPETLSQYRLHDCMETLYERGTVRRPS